MSATTPKRVAIVGGEGFLGWHLACRLGIECAVTTLTRSGLSDMQRAKELVRGGGVLINAAGINRGSEEDIVHGHDELAESICQLIGQAEPPQVLINLSSLHEGRADAYGQAKAHLHAKLRSAAQRAGVAFANVVLPNLYGEGSRPFYNSVTATFCHQVAHGEPSDVKRGNSIELLHVQDVADQVAALISGDGIKDLRVSGHTVEIGDLYDRIQSVAAAYDNQGELPDMEDRFTLSLFNTYRSHLFPDRYPWRLTKNSDPRGVLFEGIRAGSGGQSFVSTTVPGATRGNHYHFRKFERFLVVSGSGVIRLRRVRSAQTHSFPVSGDEPAFVDMPTLHTHSITNTGDEPLVTMFWTNEFFDPQRPDTIREAV